jgi:hypothetical protein
MKHPFLGICFLFISNLSSFGQQNEKQTEILIIGVNHSRTKKINYNKLYQLLEKNKRIWFKNSVQTKNNFWWNRTASPTSL